jgi:uncharacterized protein
MSNNDLPNDQATGPANEPGDFQAKQDADNAKAVAIYLADHPDFFEQHPELLTSIRVAHSHGNRTISLQERQLELVREKNRMTEIKLAELIRIGQENDVITDKLQRWTRQLLLVPEPEQLPDIVLEGLIGVFAVPQVALRFWSVKEPFRAMTFAQPVPVEVITLANSMKQPYCGPNAEFQPSSWLPDEGESTKSMALLPLRKGLDPNAFGLLVLGSADAGRFQMGMGTAFLERIAETASAALSKLIQ